MSTVYLIAEMSANHAGSLSNALDIVHAAKEAGADCVKIQTYTADTITLNACTPHFLLTRGTWAGYNLHDLYDQAHTPWDWQPRIKEEAERVGLDFLSTPFDATAVDFLEEIGVSSYKIASFELVDIPLLRYTAEKGKPMIVSTGMGSLTEIQEAKDAVFATGNQSLTLLKCISAYPARPEQMNLATLPDMARRFGVPVGLSDHSLGDLAATVAVAMGATVIEKHFCLSREIENPDASFSMEPEEFAQMARSIRAVEAAIGSPFYGPVPEEASSLDIRKSIFAAADIQKGEVFTAENIRVVRPSAGMHPREWAGLLGKRATRDIAFATPLSEDMVTR